MLCKALAGVFATAMMAVAFFALPADAASKEKKRPRSEAPSLDGRVTGPSLDGRVTGQPRTCGHDTFSYSSSGTTVGPYCH